MDLLSADRTGRFELPVLFAHGFRPFFLLAGMSAAFILATWLTTLSSGFWPSGSVPAVSWHAHEMLFGFVGAAVAGFLLTAVPNWTGSRPLSGWPLLGLVGLWLAGRLVVSPFTGGPTVTAAVVDLAFFPALAAALAVPLIRAGKGRNTQFLLLLGLLFTANLLFHLEWLGLAQDSARHGITLAIGIVLMMVTVIGGRIVPNFTLNALRANRPDLSITPKSSIEYTVLAATAAMIPADLLLPGSAVAGAVALVAAIAHGLRLARWRGLETLGKPILWILHVGYAWVVVALALKAVALLTGAGFASAWLHALTIGVFSTMILGVMTRATLGHTGRPLVVSRITVGAYAALMIAGVLRTVAPGLPAEFYLSAVDLAGLLWMIAFLLFLGVYGPMLVLPRADGKPG